MSRYRRFVIGTFILFLLLSMQGCAAYRAPRQTTNPSATATAASDPVLLSRDPSRISLGKHVEYLEDPTGTLTLREVTSPSHSRRFVPVRERRPNFGLTQSAYWFRVNLRSESDEPTEWLVEIGPPFLDAVEVFVLRSGETTRSLQMGDQFPFHQRAFPHRHFIVDLQLSPHTEQPLYVRVKDRNRVRFAMTLWRPDRFKSAQELWNLGYGILYGATLIMGVNGLLASLILRDRLFLYVSFHVFISLLIFLSWNGHAYQYLWPNRVRWHNIATLILYCLGVGIHFIFTTEFLRIRRHNPKLDRLLHLGAILAVGVLVGLIITDGPLFQQLYFILSIPTTLFFGIIGLYAWRRQEPAAQTYMLIWGLYSLSALVAVLSDLAVVPATPLTTHISQLTFVLTLPFIWVRLADRLNVTEREREEAQKEALRISIEKEQLMREQNVRLEETVEARTEELRTAKADVERSHETLQAIFDNLDMLIYVADVETYEILFVNAYTRQEFGDVEGQPCWQALQEGQTGPCDFCNSDRLIEGGQPTGIHTWEFQNTTTGRWYHIQDQVCRWPDDRLVRIEVATDITDLKQTEQQLLDQQRHLAALEERKRIGDTLHDDLGQVMSYINVQAQTALGLLMQAETSEAEGALIQLLDVARDAHADLREYIMGARQPQVPSDFFEGLTEHIATLYQRYGVRIDLQLPDNVLSQPFAPDVGKQVQSIVQEAFTNVAKHADTESAQMILQETEGGTRITIQDQGRGFDSSSLSESDAHFGLAMMRERAERLGGTLDVVSNPGSGTCVILQVPRASGGTASEADRIEDDLRIMLADDHPLFLEGLQHMLRAHGAEVVGTAHDGWEAVTMAEQHHPDVILMDVEMPDCDGIEATRRIASRLPDVKIAMLTVAVDDEIIFDALKAGASGYLLKNLDSETLFATLSDLMRDQVIITPHMASRVLTEFDEGASNQHIEDRTPDEKQIPPDEEDTTDLTPRQIEVLQTVANGLTYKEAGNQLHISERTVKYHMGQVLKRLQLKSRAQAIAYATQQGLIDDDVK